MPPGGRQAGPVPVAGGGPGMSIKGAGGGGAPPQQGQQQPPPPQGTQQQVWMDPGGEGGFGNGKTEILLGGRGGGFRKGSSVMADA